MRSSSLLLLCLVAGCISRAGFDEWPTSQTTQLAGDNDFNGSGDSLAGDPAAGDPFAGDPSAGDPAAGDTEVLRVRFTTTTVNVDEGDPAEVTIEIVPPPPGPVTVGFHIIREPTVSGIAAPADYELPASPLVVTAGGTRLLVMPTNVDGSYEGTETFRIELTDTSEGIIDDLHIATVTITDIDTPPMLTMCTDTLSTAIEGTVVDSGGEASNYSDGEYCVLDIMPGREVTLSFNALALQTSADTLTIYEGPTFLSRLTGSPGTPFDVPVAPSGHLELVFHSDGGTNDAGFVATWSSAQLDATPDPVQLPDINDAPPSTYFQEQLTVDGFDGPLTAVAIGAMELSIDSGPWSAAAEVFPGDQLGVRILSPSGNDEEDTGILILGETDTTWTVRTGPPPCTGGIGSACASGATGSSGTALNAGESAGFHMMVTPSGCADVDGSTVLDYARRELVPVTTLTPACSGGEDMVVKDWTAGSSTTVRGVFSALDGAGNTLHLAGEPNGTTAKMSIGVHPAAEYCAWLDFGGYDDWYLPATREMAHLYCLSDAGGGHNASNPIVDPDCASLGGSGPQGSLTGFAPASLYATSTEANSSTPWQIDMWSGYIDDYENKTGALRVRCVRRYQ